MKNISLEALKLQETLKRQEALKRLEALKRREALEEIQRCYQRGKGITLPWNTVMDSKTNITEAYRLLDVAIDALKGLSEKVDK